MIDQSYLDCKDVIKTQPWTCSIYLTGLKIIVPIKPFFKLELEFIIAQKSF